MERQAIVEAWCARDRETAVGRADREVVDASTALRALVVDLALPGGPDEELYDACARLGRLVAERGGSPSLAALTIDHACDAMGMRGAAWAGPAGAAVVEGFTATVVEATRREALAAWEYPRCSVRLGKGVVAIAAGHPSDDEEVLAAWAGRLARAAALDGARRVIVQGDERARAALVEAMGVAGVETG